MVYFSIVGTQTMAVVNPLLSICQKSPLKIDRVALMPTPQTLQHGKQVVEALNRAIPQVKHVDIYPISNTTEADRRGNLPAQDVLSRLLRDCKTYVLNLAGGMNFQTATCVLKSADRDGFWTYPETSGVHLHSFKNGAVEYHIVFDLPRPLDVLKYQNVPHKVVGGEPNPYLKWILGQKWINRLTLGVKIGGVLFDGICNVGNEMRFIKVIHKSQDDSRKSKVFLAEARSLIDLVAGRNRFGDLYHRSVALLTNHTPAAEHVESESGGKIRVFNTFSQETSPQLIQQELPEFIFAARKRTRSSVKVKAVFTGNSSFFNRALYVAMGLNTMATLTAIETHQPKELYVLYTPKVSKIAGTVNALKRSPKNLPAEKVHFVPVDITGEDILGLPKAEADEIHVNITPGSKAQAAFLTRWALQNSAQVFSLFTPEQQAVGLNSLSSLTMKAPSPPMYLKMSGIEVATYGKNIRSLGKRDRTRISAVLEFLRQLKAQKKGLSGFPNKKVKAGRFSFVIANKKRALKKDKTQIAWWHENEWGAIFEKLVGLVISKCGAQYVQVRMRTAWLGEKTASHIKEKYAGKKQRNPFMSDLDVVAVKDADYYVISCKGGNISGISKAANEVAAMAHIFGRFSVPLLCHLKYEGNPEEVVNGVYRFGWQTLVDKAAMQSLLETAVKKRRKTLQ